MTPAESMQLHLKALSEDFVKLAEEMAEQHQDMMRALSATNVGFAHLDREVKTMIGLFRTYVEDTSALRSEIRKKQCNDER